MSELDQLSQEAEQLKNQLIRRMLGRRNPPSAYARSASVPRKSYTFGFGNNMHAVAAPPPQAPLHSTPPPSPRAPVWSPQVPTPPASMPLSSPASNTTYTSKFVAGVSIEVVEGDITNESADAIVNPTDASLQLSGNLSQAIVAKDPSIVHECSELGTLTSAAFTNADGSLLCTYVLHVLSPSSLQECEQVLRAALRLADKQAIFSLSIPPIGTGAAGLPLQQAADTIADTIVREARGGSIRSLTRVRLVGFNQRARQAFETALTNALSGNARGPQAPLGLIPNAARNFTPRVNFRACAPLAFNPPAASQTSSKTINGVTIEVTQSNINDETTDAIVNPTSASFALDGGLSKAITLKGGPTIEQECRQQGTLTTAGAITSGGQLQCTHVIHVLSPSDLNECQIAVQAALAIANQYSLQSISFPPIGAGGRGLPCDQVASCIASEVVSFARANSLGSITLVRLVAFNANEYTEFDNALQQAVSGSGVKFPMKQAAKQRPQNKPVSPSGPLPASWAPMTTNKPSQQVEMRQTDSDYSVATKLFTLSGSSSLHRIFRIQNPTLYAQFEAEKTKMDKLYAGQWRYRSSSIEWTLYHGTDSGTLAKINGNGFDRRYCGKNATWFGQGSYFARDMAYSAQARYSPPDRMGHKWVYVARVLVGLYCQGTKDMQHPPNQPNGYPYDTAVNRTTNPSIFVIFRDIRAYPLYLYEFS